MAQSKLRKKIKQFKKRVKKHAPLIAAGAVVIFMGFLAYAEYMSNKRASVDPAVYTPLLHLIAKAESNGNYNAYFGKPNNDSVDFTAMSVADVLEWQAEFVAQGNPSSAVGRYQIINTTLEGLVRELEIDTTKKFDKNMQDMMAVALLERRGSVEYVNEELSREEFAANLAKEWAALPKVIGDDPEKSYYAGDGLNQSHVPVADILATIDRIDVQ